MIGGALPALRRPTVTPAIDGSVVLEWHSPTHHIDFTVGPDSIEVFYEVARKGWEGPLSQAPIHPCAFLADHDWPVVQE